MKKLLINTFLRSTGKKRGFGAWMVLAPMIVKYLMRLSNMNLGTDFEIDEQLLNILFIVGTTIWGGGVLHCYFPKILKWTIRIEKNLERFNEWAANIIKKKN
jgi:hypothetical protein